MTARLLLQIQHGTGIRADTIPLSRPRIRRLILASLPASCTHAQLVLRWVGSRESQQLNNQFRHKNYATNILTFHYRGQSTLSSSRVDASSRSPTTELHADLVICLPVARQEARTQKKPLDHHLSHLLVHGVLHASGLDHETDADALAMEHLETLILKRFRIANPYA